MLYQLDPKTNEVIAKFTNVKHACNHLMMNPASVRRAVNGRQATSYGFRWVQELPTCKVKVRNRLDELRAAKELSDNFDYLD